jgi:hypothetical protein
MQRFAKWDKRFGYAYPEDFFNQSASASLILFIVLTQALKILW